MPIPRFTPFILCSLCLLFSVSLVFGQDLELVWSDEFDYNGPPNAEQWTYHLGDGCPHVCGWGNNELQVYTQATKNVRVENGYLIIEAHQEQKDDHDFTSGRIASTGAGSWQYGRIEARAQLPGGKGTWGAIWMLPTNNNYGFWPASGEIDIMEHVGYRPDVVYGTVHTKAYNHSIKTHIGDSIVDPAVEDQFRLYAIDWTPDRIDFSVDKEIYFTYRKTADRWEEWPFDHPFHLIMNLAVGGNWGGKQGVDPAIWPQRMVVDYVRVYQERPAKKHSVQPILTH